MISVNNLVILKGRLTKDPEVTYAGNGRPWIIQGIAVDDSYLDKGTDKRVDRTIFVDIRAWGQTAEFMGKYCKKGDMVEVSGKLVVDAWEDKATNEKKRKTVVQATTVTNLMWYGQPKKGGPKEEPNAYNGTQKPNPPPFGNSDDFDDDIPF